MGNINATTIYNTNKWPKVLGMYWLDKIDDCEDIMTYMNDFIY